jgi:hypothetical protein
MKTDQNKITIKSIIKHALRLCVLLTTGLLLSACKPEAKVFKDVDPTGVYALVSVNGSAVRASVSHDGTALQVRSGTFTIKADGTCSTKTVFVPPSGQEATRDVSATYTKEGSKLAMKLVLHRFPGSRGDGIAPWAGLAEGPEGALYGTTLQGGVG